MTATVATDTPHSPATVAKVAKVATVAVAEHTIPALSSDEEAMIRAWLAHIRETDLEQINRLLEKCRTNLKTRQYVLEQARTVPKPSVGEQLVRCGDCLHFKRIDRPGLGHCAKGKPEAMVGLCYTHERFCEHFISRSKRFDNSE